MFEHPAELDSGIDTTDLPPHDLDVDQYDCEGCHQRVHHAHDQDVAFLDEHNTRVVQLIDLDPDGHLDNHPDDLPRDIDPGDYYPRWLRAYHGRHMCPRFVEDIAPTVTP